MNTSNSTQFLDILKAKEISENFGSPVYVYDETSLKQSAQAVLNFPNAFGLTARYAMKACPNRAILKLFHDMGLHIDASSGHEVHRAIEAGFEPEKISLSAQEIPSDLEALLGLGIRFNACSLKQLEVYGQLKPNSSVGVRFNPGSGSGGNNRTNVGGVSSSFGIWHEFVPEVQSIVERYQLCIERIHTHIGSGSDPQVWLKVALMNFQLVEQFETVKVLNLGGGYKVGRMPNEVSTDLQVIGEPVRKAFLEFAQSTGREIHLEIEPGTFLVANAGALLAEVHDIVSTGSDGYNFIKLNTGMTELLRPSIYGSQHPIDILNRDQAGQGIEKDYVVVGHCCESGDILTPASGDPELLATRNFKEVEIGDLVVIGGAGAYASAMTPKHYNSYPEAAEVLLQSDGSLKLIRKRQDRSAIWENEL
jgi:diaminopimelate decarboxylase